MSWQGIWGHDEIALSFARANSRKRIGGSFLFVGSEGIGKRTFAFALAKTLLCKARTENPGRPQDFETLEGLESFQPCNECESCRLFYPHGEEQEKNGQKKSGRVVMPNHPDFFYVSKPEERSEIPMELLVGERKSRMTSGLCYEVSKTPCLGGRKIAVLDDADFLNEEGANALLKTLEEPPPKSVFILIGTSAAKQLPTIRSRCQIIRFRDLNCKELAEILWNQRLVDTKALAEQLALNANGSATRAIEQADESLGEFCLLLYQSLSNERVDSTAFARQLNEYIDSVSKESQVRRRRLRFVLLRALDFFRAQIEYISGNDSASISAAMRPCLEKMSSTVSPLVFVRAAERTLDALAQIDRNINVPYIVDAWVDTVINKIR